MAQLVPVQGDPFKKGPSLVPVEGNPFASMNDAVGTGEAVNPDTNPWSPKSVGRSLMIGSQAAGRGLAALAGAPVDIMSLLVNGASGAANFGAKIFNGNSSVSTDQPMPPSVPGVKGVEGSGGNMESPPFLGSKWIVDSATDIANAVGLPLVDKSKMRPEERLGYDVEDIATQALTMGGGLSAAANATTKLPGALARVFELFGSKAYKNGLSPLVGDTAAGAGAGTGKFAYDEYVPDNVKKVIGPVGDLGAMLTGGVGGAGIAALAEGLMRGLFNTGKTILRGNNATDLPLNEKTGAPFSHNDVELAAAAAQRTAVDPKKAAEDIATATRGGTNGNDLAYGGVTDKSNFPTSGITSGDPGLIGAENAARAQNPVPFTTRDQRVRTVARDQVDKIAPEGALGRTFTDAAEGIQAGKEAAAAQRVATLQSREGVVKGSRGADATDLGAKSGMKPAASETLDKTVTDALTEAQSAKNAAFDDIPDVPRPLTPLTEAAAKVRANQGALNDPANVPDIVKRIEHAAAEAERTGQNSSIGFADLNALRPELAGQIAKAQREGDFALADNLRIIKKVIDDDAQRLASEGGIPGVKALAAVNLYKNEFAPVWAAGPGDAASKFRKDFNVDRTGRTTTPPSQTAGRFLQPGQAEKAASLDRILKSSKSPADGQKAVRDYLLSDMAEGGVLDMNAGVIRPDALRKWRDKWRGAIDLAPGFRDEVEAMLLRARKGERLAGGITADLKAANAKLSDVQRNKGALGLVLGKDPAKAVDAIFGSGDPERNMDALLKEIGGNQPARDGLKASVRDWLIERGTMVPKDAEGRNLLNFANLDKLFKQKQAVLAKVFSPEEMNALRRAHAFLAPFTNRGLQATTGSATAERVTSGAAWNALESALRLKYGMLKGGGIMSLIRRNVQRLPTGKEGVEQVIAQMWFDPDLARHLLTKNVSQVNTPVWNSKLLRLLGVTELSGGNEPAP